MVGACGDLVERYEELRAMALGAAPSTCRSRGLALVVRSGMAAWILAWSSCVAPPSAEPPSKEPMGRLLQRSGMTSEPSEVIAVLTQMAMDAARGMGR
jgi:hypothetical protein